MRTFASFSPGAFVGSRHYYLDQALLDECAVLYGSSTDRDGRVSGAVLTILMMRAYCVIVDDRPPGNINVGNTTSIFVRPRQGDTLQIEVSVATARSTATRLILAFDVVVKSASNDQPVARSTITLFWAA